MDASINNCYGVNKYDRKIYTEDSEAHRDARDLSLGLGITD